MNTKTSINHSAEETVSIYVYNTQLPHKLWYTYISKNSVLGNIYLLNVCLRVISLMSLNDQHVCAVHTTSCSPMAEVMELPSGLGALGSLGLAAISSSISSSS